MMIGRYARLIEAEIRKQKFGGRPRSLYEPLRYIMALGGKRLRPLLTMLGYTLFRDDPEKIVRYACAVEAFHNFTLLHDDLMDNAPLRRGKATVHTRWNRNTAILAGDVMLVKVYDMFLDLDKSMLPDVLKAFNACAAEVCEGQQWDMEFETMTSVTEQQYLRMIRKKTAVLLGFSLGLGALLAKAGEKNRKGLYDLGVNIGTGFQLKDDLLDVYGQHEVFGKQVGGDIIANKKTFLLITALEKASGRDKKELTHWLTTHRHRDEKVKAVTSIYDRLGIRELTERKINGYFTKGLRQLDELRVSQSKKQVLEEYINGLMNRQA